MSDSLIIPLLFFLPCREKAHDSNEFCRENQKPRRESRITTAVKSNTVNFSQFSLCSFSCFGGYSMRCLGVIISPYYLNTRTTMSFPFYYI